MPHTRKRRHRAAGAKHKRLSGAERDPLPPVSFSGSFVLSGLNQREPKQPFAVANDCWAAVKDEVFTHPLRRFSMANSTEWSSPNFKLGDVIQVEEVMGLGGEAQAGSVFGIGRRIFRGWITESRCEMFRTWSSGCFERTLNDFQSNKEAPAHLMWGRDLHCRFKVSKVSFVVGI